MLEAENTIKPYASSGNSAIVIRQYVSDKSNMLILEAYLTSQLFDINSTTVLKAAVSENFVTKGEVRVFSAIYDSNKGSFGNEFRFIGANICIEERAVAVSGFDYCAHYCADGAETGRKLIVKIPLEVTADKIGEYPVTTDASGLYDADGSAFACAPAVSTCVETLIDLSENPSSTPRLDRLCARLFGNCALHKRVWPTMSSRRTIGKNIYLVDYQYDYNIDDLMEKGAASAASLLAYASKHVLGRERKFKPNNCNLGCSAFEVYNENGEHITGRNFDYLDAPCYVLWTHPDNAYASISMVDGSFMFTTDHIKHRATGCRFQTMLSPYLCLDGMNEKGFAISVLQIHENGTKQDTGKTKMFTTAMIRCCLDKCASVVEAIELFKRFDIQDTIAFGYSLGCCFHYMLTDADGDAAVIEYVNNEMRVIRAASPEFERLFVANYYLSEDGGVGSDKYDPEGMERCEIIRETLAKNNNVLNFSQTFDLLSDVHLNYRHDNNLYDITTLWSCLYNNTKRTMSLAARMDYSKIYTFDVKKPMKVYSIDSIEVSTPIEGIGLR